MAKRKRDQQRCTVRFHVKRTTDAIFILEKQFNDKKKLYCAFIDVKKAFDSVSRTYLWYKSIKSGLDGN